MFVIVFIVFAHVGQSRTVSQSTQEGRSKRIFQTYGLKLYEVLEFRLKPRPSQRVRLLMFVMQGYVNTF